MNSPQHSVLETLEPRLAPAGIVIVSTAGGVLTITGTSGDDAIKIQDIGGVWQISDPLSSGTLFKVNGQGPVASTTFLPFQSIKATLNAGADTFVLDGVRLNGGLTVTGNDGIDTITLANGTYSGAVSIDSGSGADVVTIDGHFNNALSLKTGAGVDVVTINSGFFAKGISVDLGADSNTLTAAFLNTSIYGPVSIAAAGGTGALQTLTLTGTDTLIAGNVSLKITAGATNLTFGNFSGALNISGAFSCQSAAGDDTLTLLGNIQIGGAATFNLGNGTNLVQGPGLGNFLCAALSYTGGTGSDTFSVTGDKIAIGGALSITAGNGANQFEFTPTASLKIGGSLLYTGGTGVDDLTLNGPDARIGGALNFKGMNGDNHCRFLPVYGQIGSVSYAGGTGVNDLELGQFLGGSTSISIFGNITTAMGTGGAANLLLRKCFVYGSLTHASNIPASHGDSAAIRQTTVFGAVDIKMTGAAAGDIDIDDSTLYSTLNIATGDGSDVLEFDRVDGFGHLRSELLGPVKINLGAGDDFVYCGQIGINTCGNNFASTLSIDGGAGTDTVHLYLANNVNIFSTPATLLGVETDD